MNNNCVEKMYMCPICFELFTEEEAKKMLYIHKHDDIDSCNEIDFLIPIDKPIAESIAKMNKKGWTTNFSCSGHYSNEHTFSEFYVVFELDDSNFHLIPYLMKFEPVGLEYEIERNSILDISGLTNYRCRISPRNKDYWFTTEFTLGSNIAESDDRPLFTEKDYDKLLKWKDKVYQKSFEEWVDKLPNLFLYKNYVTEESDIDDSVKDDIKIKDNIKDDRTRLYELKQKISYNLDLHIYKDYPRQGFINICKGIRKDIIDALKIIHNANSHNQNLPGKINTNNAAEVCSILEYLNEGRSISIANFNSIMKILNLNYIVTVIHSVYQIQKRPEIEPIID